MIRTNSIAVVAALVAVTLPLGAQQNEPRVVVETQAPDSQTVVVAPDGRVLTHEIHGDHFLHLAGPRSLIGVRLTALTPELREHFGAPAEVGVMVSKLTEDGPAQRAGIEVADIITSADSTPIESAADLTRVVGRKDDGEEVVLGLYRDGRQQNITIAVEASQRRRIDILNDPKANGRLYRLMALPRPYLQSADADDDGASLFELDNYDEIQGALERLGIYFSSDEWKERLEHIEQMDFRSVEERMKDVESRLRELETELEKEPKD
jgi:hypothetical protein